MNACRRLVAGCAESTESADVPDGACDRTGCNAYPRPAAASIRQGFAGVIAL